MKRSPKPRKSSSKTKAAEAIRAKYAAEKKELAPLADRVRKYLKTIDTYTSVKTNLLMGGLTIQVAPEYGALYADVMNAVEELLESEGFTVNRDENNYRSLRVRWDD